MVLSKWRRRCQTEATYVYSDFRSESQGAPTACPNDTGHTLDPADTWVGVEHFSALTPIDAGSGGVLVDDQQHPAGWTYLRLGFKATFPAATAESVSYFQILNEANQPMSYYAITGRYECVGFDKFDALDVWIVIKNADIPEEHPLKAMLGGADYILDRFVRNEYLLMTVEHSLFVPNRSLLFPTSAITLNPQLPDAPLKFRVKYTANNPSTGPANPVDFVMRVEGFESPA